MAIDPVLATTPAAPIQPSLGGPGADVLAALKAGQSIDAVVLAQLETGEVRLGLLGVLLDIMPAETLVPGDRLRLTVVRPGDQLAVAVEKLPVPDTGEEPAAQPLPGGGRANVHSGAGAEADAVTFSGRAATSAVAQTADGSIARGQARAVAADPMSQAAKAALVEMLPGAATGQQGRAPLIANALAVLSGPAGEKLPPKVRQALDALIATALDPHGLDGVALRQAIGRSGSFQESNLLKLAPSPAELPQRATGMPPTLDAVRADAKSVMFALKSALQDFAGLAGAVRQSPPPLPQANATAVAQPPATATIGEAATPAEAGATLLTGTDGALDRLRLVQAASLPDDRRPADPAQRLDRLVEIPIALPNGQVPVMTMSVGRDGTGSKAGGEASWRMRLSLDLEPSGPMHALVSVRGGRAGVTLWAERQETADHLRVSLGELRDALTIADLDIDTLDVRTGAPAAAPAARAGRFLDKSS